MLSCKSNKMKKIFPPFYLLLSLLIVMSCSGTKTVATGNGLDPLYQQWKLTELMGQSIPGSSKASLQFSPGESLMVSGHTGCNRINGKVSTSGSNGIKFFPMAATKMACLDNDIKDMESTFLNALTQADNWKVSGNQLLLSNEKYVVAKFKAGKPLTAEEKKLNGTWELNYLSGAKITLDGLFPREKPRLTFNLPDTQLSGFGGCNGFGCKIKVTGNKISFGDPLSTMMACEGNGEPVFFQTLKKITSYKVNDDNTLTLVMGDIALMRFAKK